MRFLGPVAQKLVGVMVSSCFFGPFGAKSVKVAQKAKKWPRNVLLVQTCNFGAKRWKFAFFSFWVILPSGTSIWAYYSKVSCEVAEWCFFEQKQFAELISWNRNDRKSFFYPKWFPTYKSQKSTFRLLSFLRGCRVHREARGAQGALWSKKSIFCVLERKYTPFAKMN